MDIFSYGKDLVIIRSSSFGTFEEQSLKSIRIFAAVDSVNL
jgi:hypothetical protein